jgi:hypothetical protein
MPIPRPRFTLRRMMIGLAIVALPLRAIFWVAEMRTKSLAYERRAESFAWITARSGSVTFTSDGRFINTWENENHWLEDAWACKLAEKYRRLSDYPWLPVEPDPPPPTPLAKPRPAIDLPAEMEVGCLNRDSTPPAWTMLWTYRW